MGTFLHLNVALHLCFLKLKTIKINDDVFFIFMDLIAFNCYVRKGILFMFLAVLRIHMFLGSWIRVWIHWPDPDPLVKGMDLAPDPDLDPSIIMQK